ncbi:MAG: efflux RND transporter periplasmic adaptor subunit [Acidobacteria bacterium]|nr:efflux RND transporter periplasmic adaptor subunit [Acidobacteriota bacterium]
MTIFIHLFSHPKAAKFGLGFFLLALLGFSSLACKSGYPVAARSGNTPPKDVRLMKIEERPMENSIAVTGTLAAYEQATISAKVAGRLRAINVDLGSVVHKGQVIAELEQRDAELRLQQAEASLAQARARLGLDPKASDENFNVEETGTVRQAKAVLEQAQAQLNRLKALSQQGIISKSQLDSAESEHKVALSKYQDALEEIRNRQGILLQRKSEVEIAKQQILDTVIKAAFDGVVQEKRANLGEHVSSGTPIVTVVRIDPLRLRVEIPERDAKAVKQGQLVRVTVEGDSTIYNGIIQRLSPAISAQNRVLVVEAEVRNNGQLKPGAFAKADIIVNATSMTIAVPTNTLVSFAGIDKVIAIQDGKALEKPVTLGRHNGDWVEVLAGIKAGEAIVIDPGNLQTGQPVNIIQ